MTTNKFQTTAPPVQPLPPPYSDRQFLHTYAAGAMLPLIQASITAGLLTLAMGLVLYLLNVLDWAKWALITGVFVWVATWLFLQRRWLNLTTLETFFGVELDGIPNEPPKKMTIFVNKVKENGHVEQMQHVFPASEQQIQRFFTTVKTSTRGGKGISRRLWTPKRVHGFSEGEWDLFFGELVKQKLVMVQSGETILTPEGEEIADGWYARAPTPPPAEDA